ncbi:MAG: zinc ABC transporter substrate-binding protein, partial [Pseudomonadales bacterium]|nr:zinc ABC transporter substrate-binding protein [Pseudomonadales bacterium]
MKFNSIILAAACLLTSASAFAKLNIFACEPEWAALAGELGGDKIEAYAATTPFQDPHFIQARPSLIARVRRADLVVCSGANLEIGWLPVLLRQSGNGKVNVGTDGFLDASQSVTMLDVPGTADRAAGDIHPYGNPHFQTDARNIGKVADTLSARLKSLDPANADFYQSRHDAFKSRWDEAVARWEAEAASLKGMQIVVHHASWVYMENWLGLVEVGQMEPKPGLPPTASHLAELLDVVKSHNVKAFVRSAYQSPRAADWLADRTGLPDLVIPQTVGATDAAKDLFSMFDEMIRL